MTSELDAGLCPPTRANACRYLCNTEAQARAAFFSHERLIREAGRFDIVGTAPAPAFVWTPSPTFGRPLKVPAVGGGMRPTRTVTTSCLRTEFVMIGYAYVLVTVNNVLREYADFVARLNGITGVAPPHTRDEARDLCKRLYEVYLVLVDRIKPHVLLHTIGNLAPPCAELSIHTANGLIAYVAGLHAVVAFTFYEIIHAPGEAVPFATRRDVFMFASHQFLRAYSIFTLHVWPAYAADAQQHARFQRYLLGAALFYQARAIVCAIRHEKSGPKWSPAAVLVLARRAECLLAILRASPAFGFRANADRLSQFTDKWIETTLPAVSHDFPFRAKITSVQQYRGGDQFTTLIFSDKMARSMLHVHYKKSGRFFRSTPIDCSLARACLFSNTQ